MDWSSFYWRMLHEFWTIRLPFSGLISKLNVISRFSFRFQCHFGRSRPVCQCQNQVKRSGVRHTGESESAYDRTATANEGDVRFQVKAGLLPGQSCVILVLLTLAGQWHNKFPHIFSQTIPTMSIRSKSPRADGSRLRVAKAYFDFSICHYTVQHSTNIKESFP